MDYKYIEQLLERYWECQTTLEEESILCTFFAQEDVPASLLPYRDLFLVEEEMAEEQLSDDFEARLMEKISSRNMSATTQTPPLRISLSQRFAPFYRAAAVVAVVLTIGMAAQQGFQGREDSTSPYQELTASHSEDTIRLFTDMPELSEQTEAALPSAQADTLKSATP